VKMKKASIVVPVYNEEKILETFFNKLSKALEEIPGFDWEIIFVDDGSNDGSWEKIKKIVNISPYRIKAFRFSRNFGKELALTAGIEHVVDADLAICIDADLQHPPELIKEMVKRWFNGADIVVAVRQDVEDFSFFRKFGSKIFYWIMSRYSSTNLCPGSTDFRLLDKKVIEVLKTFRERTRLFRGLIDWMGFKKDFVYFIAPGRNNGSSSFGLKTLINLAINSFTVFSLLPLKFTGYLGLFITLFSFLLLLFMFFAKFFMHWTIRPIAFFVVFNTFLFGIVLCALGLIALYIGHIYTEVVGRPLYIIKESLQKTSFNENSNFQLA